MQKLTTLAAVLMTALLLVGNAGADKLGRAFDKTEAATREAAQETKDSWLTAKTKIELLADSRVAGTQIHVETKHGVITLRGKVDTDAAKSAAEAIAQAIDGKKEVRNELQVVPQSRRKMIDARDDYIVETIKERLTENRLFLNNNIDVRSDAGVVTLSGEAPNISASAIASQIASGVDGVRCVKNSLVPKL